MNIRIQYKLFLAILATAGGVVVCMFLVMRWSFDRGFFNYVNKLDLERLNALAKKLEESYSREGSWQFLQDDPQRWNQLLRDSLPDRFKGSLPPAMPEGRSPGEKDSISWYRNPPEGMPPPPPHASGPPGIGPPFGGRVVLLDGGKNRIVGMSEFPRNLELKPLQHGSKFVGYLGMLPPKILADPHQSRFVEEQRQTFAIIALAMVVLAAVVSIPLAQQMVKRIRELALATHRLAAGKYAMRIPVTSTDELGLLARDFNTLALTLEKNEQARRHWVADISHELRTPLSVLRGEIEAMQDGVRVVTPEAISALHGEVMKLSRLVHDLYELSLSDIGALTYRMTDINLGEVLKQALELARPEFADKNIALKEDLPVGQGFPMFADPERLHQLFSNLLENSLKYTDSGGRVRVRIERQGAIATVHFQDTAPGVPETETGKLFDRLYRVEGSRNRDTGGAGLGLSICRNIVEAHKGTIEALPSPLGGLWVKVKLPLNG
jgi:two-component system sensor histidine kinase BaeS